MNVAFVTPAFQRFDLSRICFEQRVWAIEKLRASGIEAFSVVVADDDNLKIAEEFGFETVLSDNEWLGKRFNDGYEHAAKMGATHFAPIGSDSWIDPQFIIDAVKTGSLRSNDVISSRHYTRINAIGTIRRQLWVPVLQGVSYVLPIASIAQLNFRPCQDEIRRGCDGSTWQRIRTIFDANVVWSESNQFDTVGFESWPQITAFEKLGGRWGRGDSTTEVISALTEVYPEALVAKMEDFYAQRRAQPNENGLTVSEIDDKVKQITMQVLQGKVPTAVRQKARPYIEQAVRLALEQR